MIDLHCHILPGIDDGAQSLEESVAMARQAVEDGVQTVVATPHLFRGDDRPPDFSLLKRKHKELRDELERKGIGLTLLSGVEVRFNHNLLSEIQKHRDNVVLNGSAYMFLEFPFEYVYTGVKDVFFQVMNEGIIPIIAHPERNTVFARHPELLCELVQMGALAQANAGSFTGGYGSQVQEAAGQFLRLNYIHFIASDGHDTRSRTPRLSAALKSAAALLGDPAAARALVLDNPQAVLEDAPVPYMPDPILPAEEHRERTLKFKIPSLFKPKK